MKYAEEQNDIGLLMAFNATWKVILSFLKKLRTS